MGVAETPARCLAPLPETHPAKDARNAPFGPFARAQSLVMVADMARGLRYPPLYAARSFQRAKEAQGNPDGS